MVYIYGSLLNQATFQIGLALIPPPPLVVNNSYERHLSWRTQTAWTIRNGQNPK